MSKEEVYKQIEDFYNSKENRNDSETVGKKYYYVNNEKASNIANFFKYLKEEKKVNIERNIQVMDLCFGSGNLTSHIALELDSTVSKVYFNDIETNEDVTNQSISIDEISEVHDFNFLEFESFLVFKNKIDLLVFNPTISTNDIENKITISYNDKLIIENEKLSIEDSFTQYCKNNGFDIDSLVISNQQKLITVDFKNKNKNELIDLANSFNDYSIKYKTKNMRTYEDKTSVVVKINQTINTLLSENGIVVFVGTDKDREAIFQNYNVVYKYLQSDNDVFILSNGEYEVKECYDSEEGCFYEVDCDSNNSTSEEIIENFDDLILELDEYETIKNSRTNLDNELLFRSWLYSNTKIKIDNKTKNAYFNGLKRFSNEFSLNIFSEDNIEKLENLKQSLTSDGVNYEYNKKEGYNPSNGLKQYISFISDESNAGDIENEQKNIDNNEDNFFKFSNEKDGNIKFPHKNILLKGVPGTGKSKTIDNIIFNEDKLNMKNLSDNILRINIHSASSNSDLMQGVSISTTEDNKNVLYKEKQGAILNHIFKAIYKPEQPFALILEEIQENSLNELIGDLIYLIEDKKRTIVDLEIENDTVIAYDDLFKKIYDKYKEQNKDLHKVELPSLVENSQKNTQMIVPNNLFIFCTSNYRDDKKVIEDNLLRRFDVVEIYPTYKKEIYKSEDIPKFLKKLNNEILVQFKDETHPDRFMIGHANWLDVEEIDDDENKIKFYKALLKVIVEFKEIREIDFDSDVKPILEKLFKKVNGISDRIEKYLNIFYKDDKLELKSYKNIVDILQQEVYKSFL